MSSAAPLLEARDITFSRLAEGGQRQPILRQANLTVNKGEILTVVGPSGCGKSTMLRLCNRLLEPDSGQVLLDGENIRAMEPSALRARIPLVAQKPFLFQGSVLHNLQSPARLRRTALPAKDDPALLQLLEQCQITPSWLERDAHKLSIGQQQRICVARALIGPCQVMLLDEPTSALDRPTTDLMAQTFRQLAGHRNLGMVIVTHDLRFAERCADRVALMLDGAVVETGTPAQLLHEPTTDPARAFLSAEPVQ